LLTADKDFGELIFLQRRVTFRSDACKARRACATSKAEIVVAAIEAHGSEFAFGFSVVTSKGIRIRRVQN